MGWAKPIRTIRAVPEVNSADVFTIAVCRRSRRCQRPGRPAECLSLAREGCVDQRRVEGEVVRGNQTNQIHHADSADSAGALPDIQVTAGQVTVPAPPDAGCRMSRLIGARHCGIPYDDSVDGSKAHRGLHTDELATGYQLPDRQVQLHLYQKCSRLADVVSTPTGRNTSQV